MARRDSISRDSRRPKLKKRRKPIINPVLREIRQQLDLICSCVIVVHHALTEQNALLDKDAALVLKRHVADPLYEQVLRIARVLGDHREQAS